MRVSVERSNLENVLRSGLVRFAHGPFFVSEIDYVRLLIALVFKALSEVQPQLSNKRVLVKTIGNVEILGVGLEGAEMTPEWLLPMQSEAATWFQRDRLKLQTQPFPGELVGQTGA